MVVNSLFEGEEGEGAGVAPEGVAVAEKHKRRDGLDAVEGAESLLLVDVHFQDANVFAHIFFQLLQNRMHRLTWTAPGGIEID